MQRLIDAYVDALLFDMDVFSRPWIYWCFLIPAVCYLSFFFIKWAVLTAPVWLPVALIVQAFRKCDCDGVRELAETEKEKKAG